MSESADALGLTISKVVSELSRLDDDERRRVLRALQAFFDVKQDIIAESHGAGAGAARDTETKESPKDFMMRKQPGSDVERLACLGFYLTRYMETPQFKTEDLTNLNFQAAQLRFNAIVSAKNAVKSGLFIPAGNGRRQLSALGEQVVEALPDRDAVRKALAQRRPRRKPRQQRTRQL